MTWNPADRAGQQPQALHRGPVPPQSPTTLSPSCPPEGSDSLPPPPPLPLSETGELMVPTFARMADWEAQMLHEQAEARWPTDMERDLAQQGWWSERAWRQHRQLVYRGIEPL